MKSKKYVAGPLRLKRKRVVKAIKVIDLINKKTIIYSPKQLNVLLNGELKDHITPLELLNLVLIALLGKHELYNHEYKTRKDVGHPDYLIRRTWEAERESIYVEFKNLGDSIRVSQIEWIFNNQDKKTLIICFI